MNWIQNDNHNLDGVDQHPQKVTVIITSSLVTFYSIMLRDTFDDVLCQMIVLYYMWKHLLTCFCFLFTCFFCVEILYSRCVLVPPTV